MPSKAHHKRMISVGKYGTHSVRIFYLRFEFIREHHVNTFNVIVKVITTHSRVDCVYPSSPAIWLKLHSNTSTFPESGVLSELKVVIYSVSAHNSISSLLLYPLPLRFLCQSLFFLSSSILLS